MNFKNFKNSLRPKLIWIFVFSLIISFSFGCSSKHSKLVAKQAEMNAFLQEYGRLFPPYLTGYVEQARQSIKQTIQFVEASNIDPEHQAGDLYLDCYRWYILEKRTGNDKGAEYALIKASYWRLRYSELRKESEDEIINDMSSLTPEKIMIGVNNFDEGANNGNKPKYLQYITNSPSEENTNSSGKVP